MSNWTPLGSVDPTAVEQFWQRCLAAGHGGRTDRPDAWAFGDSVELADELIELVLAGTKRATAGAVADYEADGEPLPQVGDLEIVTDGSMRPRALLAITEVRIGPLSSVDDRFAYDEGEGDRSRSFWLAAHTDFFQRFLPTIGVEFDQTWPPSSSGSRFATRRIDQGNRLSHRGRSGFRGEAADHQPSAQSERSKCCCSA